MKIFTILFLLLLANTTFSATLIRGVLTKGTILLPVNLVDYFSNDQNFPKKNYEIMDVAINRLSENLFLQNIKINANSYQLISATGNLDLESYNVKTGDFKFRLTINSQNLVNVHQLTMDYEKIPIKGRLFFSETHKPEMYIQGRVSFINKEKADIHLNDKNLISSFDSRHNLILKVIQDIPVVIEEV